jgi:hypothetical protein
MKRLACVLAALSFSYATATGRNLVNSSIVADDAIVDNNTTPGYTIITTSAIQSTSSQLNNFIAHKQSLGFDVQVITEADFGGGSGDTAAENIRAWLQDHYLADNIEYVLLIPKRAFSARKSTMTFLSPRNGCASDYVRRIICKVVIRTQTT